MASEIEVYFNYARLRAVIDLAIIYMKNDMAERALHLLEKEKEKLGSKKGK